MVKATELMQAWPVLSAPGRLIGKVPKWMNWLGRRLRRIVTRAGARLQLPTANRVRQKLGVGHAPPDAQLSPEAADLYRRLCAAIDRQGDAA
jgi:hypothetical protein